MFKPIKQEDCDRNVPEQFAAFAVQYIHRPVGDPVMVQPQFTPFTSAVLWALGFRHVAEEQTHRLDEAGNLIPIEEGVGGDDSAG